MVIPALAAIVKNIENIFGNKVYPQILANDNNIKSAL